VKCLCVSLPSSSSCSMLTELSSVPEHSLTSPTEPHHEYHRPLEPLVLDLRRLCPTVVVPLAIASHQGEEAVSFLFFAPGAINAVAAVCLGRPSAAGYGALSWPPEPPPKPP
jgi:hypothetical protein